MIVLILAALIALVARVDAANAAGAAEAADEADDDAIDLAIRYADALTGIGSDPRRAPTLDAYDELDESDEVDELDDLDELDEVDDVNGDDATASLRGNAREGNGDGGDDRDAIAALRSDAREDSDDRGDHDDATGHLAAADDSLPTIDPNLERDEDDDALAVADLDSDGDTENSEIGNGGLALLDAELDPGDAMAGGDAVVAAAPAGAAEIYEQSLRHQRPSPWGRLDVGVSLRRRWSEPMHAPPSRRDEVWLVATWRR
jgi:hypothetical protein